MTTTKATINMKRGEAFPIIALTFSSALLLLWHVTDGEYTIYTGCVRWMVDNYDATVSLVYETDVNLETGRHTPVGGMAGGKHVVAEF